jgi:uncharacterized protein (DUF934 family)
VSGRTLLAGGGWDDHATRIVRAVHGGPVDVGDVLPLPAFLALDDEARDGVGVWLAPNDDPAQLAPFVDRLALVAVDFPSFRDGRGYSTAVLLRTRFGFRGDLRAIGEVLIDQLFYLRRVGFTSFALRSDQDPELAAAAMRPFSDVYQGCVDQPLPYFRRRSPAGALT